MSAAFYAQDENGWKNGVTERIPVGRSHLACMTFVKEDEESMLTAYDNFNCRPTDDRF